MKKKNDITKLQKQLETTIIKLKRTQGLPGEVLSNEKIELISTLSQTIILLNKEIDQIKETNRINSLSKLELLKEFL